MNNLIFDGNYFAFKTLFVSSYGNKGNLMETQKSQDIFMRKMATDFCHAVRQFGKPNRIIFTMDSRSWRKDVFIEENDGYKSNRKKSSEVNWENFYGCMEEFGRILEKSGIIFSKVDRAEGDDLMHLWAERLRLAGENSIVITGDHDLLQLVRSTSQAITTSQEFYKTGNIAVYNPNSKNRKIYIHENWAPINKENDIFNLTETIGNVDLIQNAMKKIPVTRMCPHEFVCQKILVGDDGDAVPSIFHWPTKTGKKNRITPKRAERIMEYLSASANGKFSVFDLPNHAMEITEELKVITKVKNIDVNEIKSKLERNIKLMVLHETVFPDDIVANFDKHFDETKDTMVSSKTVYNLNTILKDTKYISDTGTEFDLFKLL